MAKDEEQLSPEEKLLRVIQGGDKRKAAAPAPATPAAVAKPVAAPPASGVVPAAASSGGSTKPAPASPAPAAAAPEGGRGGVRLKRKDPASPGGAAAAAPPTGMIGAKTVGGAGATASGRRAAAAAGPSLWHVNIVLAALICIVLLFTGYEILANVRVEDRGPQLEALNLPTAPELDAERDLPPLDALLDALDARPVFAVSTEVIEPDQPVVSVPPDQYCSLSGISRIEETGEMEAIIKDSKLNKMLYLKAGDVITADGQLWTLKEIQGDRVIFVNGHRESVVR